MDFEFFDAEASEKQQHPRSVEEPQIADDEFDFGGTHVIYVDSQYQGAVHSAGN